MTATSGIIQDEAGEYSNETHAEVNTAEKSSEGNRHPNSLGRIRAQDIIDPYQISRARRRHPNWSIKPEEPRDDCGCM